MKNKKSYVHQVYHGELHTKMHRDINKSLNQDLTDIFEPEKKKKKR